MKDGTCPLKEDFSTLSDLVGTSATPPDLLSIWRYGNTFVNYFLANMRTKNGIPVAVHECVTPPPGSPSGKHFNTAGFIQNYKNFHDAYIKTSPSLNKALNNIAANNYSALTGPYKMLIPIIEAARNINMDTTLNNFYQEINSVFSHDTIEHIQTILGQGISVVGSMGQLQALITLAVNVYQNLCSSPAQLTDNSKCGQQKLFQQLLNIFNSPDFLPMITKIFSLIYSVPSCFDIPDTSKCFCSLGINHCTYPLYTDYSKFNPASLIHSFNTNVTPLTNIFYNFNPDGTLIPSIQDLMPSLSTLLISMADTSSNSNPSSFARQLNNTNIMTGFTPALFWYVDFVKLISGVGEVLGAFYGSCPEDFPTTFLQSNGCQNHQQAHLLGVAIPKIPQQPTLKVNGGSNQIQITNNNNQKGENNMCHHHHEHCGCHHHEHCGCHHHEHCGCHHHHHEHCGCHHHEHCGCHHHGEHHHCGCHHHHGEHQHKNKCPVCGKTILEE